MLCEAHIDVHHADKFGKSPLHKHVALGNIEVVKILLEYGSDPNTEDERDRRTSLQLAAIMCDYDMLSTLIMYSQVKCKIEKPDFDGNSLLHLVTLSDTASGSHMKCILLLLDQSCSVKAVNIKGITPLHFLCSNTYLCTQFMAEPIVECFLDLGANTNAEDVDGCTPLIIAAAHREWHLCRLLLENGADMNIPCPMNASLLRRGDKTITQDVQIQMVEDCTASDLIPRSARSQVFPAISSPQTMMSPTSRTRCMNCARLFSDFNTTLLALSIVSYVAENCQCCGRVLCPECISPKNIKRKQYPQFLLDSSPDSSSIKVCVVCFTMLDSPSSRKH